jgi:hypothetical protein
VKARQEGSRPEGNGTARLTEHHDLDDRRKNRRELTNWVLLVLHMVKNKY